MYSLPQKKCKKAYFNQKKADFCGSPGFLAVFLPKISKIRFGHYNSHGILNYEQLETGRFYIKYRYIMGAHTKNIKKLNIQ